MPDLPSPIFETDRLIARLPERRDIPDQFEIYRDPEVMRYLGTNAKPVESLQEMEELFEKRAVARAVYPEGKGAWALELKETRRVIGTIIFKPISDGEGNPTGDIEIGWHIGQSYWGQGLATEAASAIVRYAFTTDLELAEVIAVFFPANIASERVMQKIGMTHQGETEKYYGELLTKYRLTREDYEGKLRA